MRTFARMFRSLLTSGAATARPARRQLAIRAARLSDRRFDRRRGTETGIVVENEALRDVTSPNLARGIRYEPTRAIPFERLLRAARIPARGTFVDVGCGKGRVLMLAAMHGFQRVAGIDYSPSLCASARRNLATLRAVEGIRFDDEIHAIDAVDYRFQPGDAVVFLFNPFDDVVLKRVLANLGASLAAHPRPLWVVYHNPVWRAAVEEAGFFGRAEEYSFGGCDFAVYRAR